MRTTVIVTALGPDSHGLLAQVATTIAEQNANVDDVSQTVANGMFTMIMFVSFDQGETTIADLKEAEPARVGPAGRGPARQSAVEAVEAAGRGRRGVCGAGVGGHQNRSSILAACSRPPLSR